MCTRANGPMYKLMHACFQLQMACKCLPQNISAGAVGTNLSRCFKINMEGNQAKQAKTDY